MIENRTLMSKHALVQPHTAEMQEEAVKQEFLIITSPFLIRGHHLVNYAHLLRSDKPERVVKNFRKGLEEDLLLPMDVSHQEYVKYARDLLGETQDSADDFEKKMTATYSSLVLLPDQHKVALVTRPDEICKAPSIGKHCYFSGNPQADERYLRKFLLHAERAGVKDDLEVSTEMVDNAFLDQVETIKIDTTLGVIRHVLLNEDFKAF